MEPRTILVADDDPAIREVLRLLLTGEGYRVLEAADGGEVDTDYRVNLGARWSF